MSNLNPHHSLPARPPQSSYSAPPRQNQNQNRYGFAPQMSAAPSYPNVMPPQEQYYSGGYQPNVPASSAGYYQQQQPGYGTSTPMPMANSYGAPAAMGRVGPGAYNPEEEAKIAEWQSGYVPKDDSKKSGMMGNANTIALGTKSDATGSPAPEAGLGGDGANKGKEKTVVRQGGGKTWEDPSLLEWNPLHPRLFVGNLAGEVTDDSLLKAFSKYPSVSKARVIRDKITTKSKSYGFVSFSNTDDYFRAAKEMQGKYIGSHPVRITRAKTEMQVTTKRDDKHGKHGKNNQNKNKKKQDAGTALSGAATYNTNSGIFKSSKKGGPRILG